MGTGNIGRFSTVLQEMEANSADFTSVRFVYESGSSNADAHRLAKSVVSLETGRHVLAPWYARPVLYPLKL
jgi:hypothetical protein